MLITLLCTLTWVMQAQMRRHEVELSWIPVASTMGERPNGFQAAYLYRIRSWYQIGGSVFRFGSKGVHTENEIKNTFSDFVNGGQIVNRFTTPQSLWIGMYAQAGIAVLNQVQVSQIESPFGPTVLPREGRYVTENWTIGGSWSTGLFLKPTQRLLISGGVNLYAGYFKWLSGRRPAGMNLTEEGLTAVLSAAWQF
jgi:hypothetical protein